MQCLGTRATSPTPPTQVYTVAGGKNVPSWLSDKKKKALRKDEEYRRRRGRRAGL